MTDRRPHYPPAQPPAPDSALGRALRDGHPTIPSLFDPLTDHEQAILARTTGMGTPPAGRPVAAIIADDLTGPGLTGAQHPATSATAGAGDKGTERQRILDAIRNAGPTGLTARELVEMNLSPSTNQACIRLLELRGDADGWEPLVARVWDPLEGDGKHTPVVRDGAAVHVSLDYLPGVFRPIPPRRRPRRRALVLPPEVLAARATIVAAHVNRRFDKVAAADVLDWFAYLLGETDDAPDPR